MLIKKIYFRVVLACLVKKPIHIGRISRLVFFLGFSSVLCGCSVAPGFHAGSVSQLFSQAGNASENQTSTLVYDAQTQQFVRQEDYYADGVDVDEITAKRIATEQIATEQIAAEGMRPAVEEPTLTGQYTRYSKATHNSSARDFATNQDDDQDDSQIVVSDGMTLKLVQVTPYTIGGLTQGGHQYQSLSSMQKLHGLLQGANHEYRLASGDTALISLWAYPQLIPQQSVLGGASTQPQGFTIDSRGDIYLPLIGKVRAAGLTLPQLTRELKTRFAKYLKYPDATIKITQYGGKRYFVTGSVKKPGQQAIEGQWVGLLDAISQAGGATETTNFHDITLLRQGISYHMSLEQMTKSGLNPNDLLIQSGDYIKVGSSLQRQIKVLGEAGTPSALTIPEDGMSLATALAQSRGINPLTADAKQIYVVRSGKAANSATLYRIDLTKLENMALANQFAMQPKDTVYVDASGLARWNRIISLILPSASAINTGKSIAD